MTYFPEQSRRTISSQEIMRPADSSAAPEFGTDYYSELDDAIGRFSNESPFNSTNKHEGEAQ